MIQVLIRIDTRNCGLSPSLPQVRRICYSLIDPFLRLSTYEYSFYTRIISTARNTSIECLTCFYPKSTTHLPHPTPTNAESAIIACGNNLYPRPSNYSSNYFSNCSCFWSPSCLVPSPWYY
jgi:hypothetical protein